MSETNTATQLGAVETMTLLMSLQCFNDPDGASDADFIRCDSESTMLIEDPTILQDTESLLKACAIKNGSIPEIMTCQNMIIQNQRKVLYHKIAKKEVHQACKDQYKNDTDTANVCIVFGNGYIDHEVDFSKVHGYDAGVAFQKGLVRLKDSVKYLPPHIQPVINKNILRLAADIYNLNNPQTYPQGKKKTYDGAIDDAIQHSKSFSEGVKTHDYVANQMTLKSTLINKAMQRFKTLEATNHPLYQALKIALPAFTWSYLSTLIASHLSLPIEKMTITELSGVNSDDLLIDGMIGLSASTPSLLATHFAKFYYSMLDLDFDQVGSLVYSPDTKSFVYNGISYKEYDLPFEARFFGIIMIEVSKWHQKITSSPAIHGAIKTANDWLIHARHFINLPTGFALTKGITNGFGDLREAMNAVTH